MMKSVLYCVILTSVLLDVSKVSCSHISRVATRLGAPKAPQKIKKENLSYSQKIEKKIDELEKRYAHITEEFTNLANYQREHGSFASNEDKERFQALLQEGDEIFEEKKRLMKQLETLKKGPGGFSFQEPENAPYRRLYQAAQGGYLEMGMAKTKKQSEASEKMKTSTPEKNEVPTIQSGEERKAELQRRIEAAKKKIEEQKSKLAAKRIHQKLGELQYLEAIEAPREQETLLELYKKAPIEKQLQPLQKPQRKNVTEEELKKSLKHLHASLINISAQLR